MEDQSAAPIQAPIQSSPAQAVDESQAPDRDFEVTLTRVTFTEPKQHFITVVGKSDNHRPRSCSRLGGLARLSSAASKRLATGKAGHGDNVR